MRGLNESAQAAIWSEGEGPRPPAEPPGSAPASKPPARFQPINRQQMVLRAVDVEQLVEPDHVVRAIWEITGRLNLRSYTDPVRAVEGEAGRPESAGIAGIARRDDLPPGRPYAPPAPPRIPPGRG